MECGGEVIVTKNGKEIGRLIPKEKCLSYLTDSLTGILKEGNDYRQEKSLYLNQKLKMAE